MGCGRVSFKVILMRRGDGQYLYYVRVGNEIFDSKIRSRGKIQSRDYIE